MNFASLHSAKQREGDTVGVASKLAAKLNKMSQQQQQRQYYNCPLKTNITVASNKIVLGSMLTPTSS